MPYVLDRNPCGSSSGSGVVAAADLAVAAVGTETDGSIVCPSGANSVVGIKPTLGLWSRAGVIPISADQDTAGPMARNVTDAAVLLGAATGVDPDDAATAAQAGNAFTDYTQFLDDEALDGARIGVWRAGTFGPSTAAIVEPILADTIAALEAEGATVSIRPISISRPPPTRAPHSRASSRPTSRHTSRRTSPARTRSMASPIRRPSRSCSRSTRPIPSSRGRGTAPSSWTVSQPTDATRPARRFARA